MIFLKNWRLSISTYVADNFDVLYDRVHKTENSFQMDENGSKIILVANLDSCDIRKIELTQNDDTMLCVLNSKNKNLESLKSTITKW